MKNQLGSPMHTNWEGIWRGPRQRSRRTAIISWSCQVAKKIITRIAETFLKPTPLFRKKSRKFLWWYSGFNFAEFFFLNNHQRSASGSPDFQTVSVEMCGLELVVCHDDNYVMKMSSSSHRSMHEIFSTQEAWWWDFTKNVQDHQDALINLRVQWVPSAKIIREVLHKKPWKITSLNLQSAYSLHCLFQLFQKHQQWAGTLLFVVLGAMNSQKLQDSHEGQSVFQSFFVLVLLMILEESAYRGLGRMSWSWK